MKLAANIFRAQFLVGAFLLVSASIYAQQHSLPQAGSSPDAPSFKMKSSVYRVIVNVTVTDNHGNPVHGLTRNDFTLKEDGVPQRVLYFRAHNFDKGMTYTPPKYPALPPDTFVNLPSAPERGPLYVLLYDLVNIPIKYQPVARAQLVKFIKAKPAGARMAIIVSSDGLHLVQGFTTSRQKLLAAVNPKSSRAHVPMVFLMGINFGQGDPVSATGRLDEVAQYLAPMPGRKNLIWFSSKFPIWLFASLQSTVPLHEMAKKTLNLLADNQIAVYPVDATGLPTYESYSPRLVIGGAAKQISARRSGTSKQSNSPPVPAATTHGVSHLYQSYWTQDSIAKLTGGEAIYSRNRLAGALAKAVEDGGSYYTLMYSPSNTDFQGHLRHIKVMLTSGHYHLSYRRAYFGTRESAQNSPNTQSVKAMMEHGAPEYHQLIFGVHLQKGPSSHSAETYTVLYTVMAQPLRAAGDKHPSLQIAAAAYGSDGKLLNSTINKVESPSAGTNKYNAPRKVYQMEIRFTVPRAAKYLRFGVRDLRTGKMGALEIQLPL